MASTRPPTPEAGSATSNSVGRTDARRNTSSRLCEGECSHISRCSRHSRIWISLPGGEETKRELKHAQRAHRNRDGYTSVVDRYVEDDKYADRIDVNGISTETMQEWDALYEKRERSPLPVFYDQRKRKYAHLSWSWLGLVPDVPSSRAL